MRVLYSLGIFLYGVVIRLAALSSSKAKLWVAGRKNLFDHLRDAVKKDTRPILWFHCASLGEFEQGRPLMERLRAQHPEYRILLTFFSPSGYEVRKNYAGADIVTYIPLDTKSNARRFLNIVQPKLVVFVKYEFWLHHLEEISKRNIPHYLVSAIFRDNQVFFKPHGGIFRSALKNYTHIFTQNETSLTLIKKIGIASATVAGDTRFDRVAEIAAGAKDIAAVEHFSKNRKVIVAGSTWDADEEHLFPAIVNYLYKYGWSLIIAPHEITKSRIAGIESSLNAAGVDVQDIARFSGIPEGQENSFGGKVLIIDNIGMLSSLYRYGDIAYIGGGFGKSIHNTLEAAVYSIPVVFGPMYQKFNEALGLIACKGGFGVHDANELQTTLDGLLSNESFRKAAGERAGEFVKNNTGATQKILRSIAV
jgi:3-deoxy-D-manno-octulosonic-acid transferase